MANSVPSRPAILIPAYRPGRALVELVSALGAGKYAAIVVVDDGSGSDFQNTFDRFSALANVTVLRHARNRGKGAALKTGIAFVLSEFPNAAGVITVDADGQHEPTDVGSVCARFEASPTSLVMGVRDFQGNVPLRSRLGNQLTGNVMRVVLGGKLSDTQTGLRAIPRSLLPRLLGIGAAGYEFELEMLIAAKHLGTPLLEQPIRTIYETGNPTSHFRPFRDSMRIYFVLLRFSLIALASAAIDNLLFLIVYEWLGMLLPAQLLARLIAGAFNYNLLRNAAFQSGQPHLVLLPRYILLMAVNTVLSYSGIEFLARLFQLPVLPAKLLTESILFIANFVLTRDFVFTRREPRSAPRVGNAAMPSGSWPI